MADPQHTNEQLARYQVPLGGFVMQLHRWELMQVSDGLGTFDSSEEGNLLTLVEALRRMPETQRAPTWELTVRRYGHHRPLDQAAGEIGLDSVRARALMTEYRRVLAEVPPPDTTLLDTDSASELEASQTARFMSAELLGNAIAEGDPVDLDAAHEASLRAADEAAGRAPQGDA